MDPLSHQKRCLLHVFRSSGPSSKEKEEESDDSSKAPAKEGKKRKRRTKEKTPSKRSKAEAKANDDDDDEDPGEKPFKPATSSIEKFRWKGGPRVEMKYPDNFGVRGEST